MANGIAGVQLYSCREFTQTIEGVADTLKKVKDIGYKSVQVSGFGPVDPKDVAKLVADIGLDVGGTHVAWSRFLDDLDAVIEEHKMWNCKHAAIGGLFCEYNYYSAEGLKKFLDELAPVAEKLAAEGIDFSYHNHHHELMKYDLGKTWLQAVYEQASPDMLKAEIDVHWIVAGGGDPAQWVRDIGPRQPLLHLKDFILFGDDKERRFAPIGEGNLNWQAIIEAGEAVNVEYYLVEQDDCYGEDPFECLATSYRNLLALGVN